MPNYIKIINENFDDLADLSDKVLYELTHGSADFETVYGRLNRSATNIYAHLGSSKATLDRQRIWIDRYHPTFTRGSHELAGRSATVFSTHAGLLILDSGSGSEIIKIVQDNGQVEDVSVSKNTLLLIPNAVTRSWPNINNRLVILTFEITI